MRAGPNAVARAWGARLTLLVALAALLALVGDPRAAGVAGGALVAIAVIAHAIVFGVTRNVGAFAPSVLRAASVYGVALAAGAGVFAATGSAFGFIEIDIARTPASVGGGLLHLSALVVIGGGGALIYQCLAARGADDAR